MRDIWYKYVERQMRREAQHEQRLREIREEFERDMRILNTWRLVVVIIGVAVMVAFWLYP